jgi:hypothetical protein
MLSINCIEVDCENLSKCKCSSQDCGAPEAHFKVPQILLDWGASKAVRHVSSVDRQHPFLVYTTSLERAKTYRKYRKRGRNKPLVYIDTTPNERGFYDCFIFNAPMIEEVSIVAIFKDPR